VNRDPAAFTMEQHKNKRYGRAFIDTNRNAYAQTAVAPYALHARDGRRLLCRSTGLNWARGISSRTG